jgi:hypothetical protein
MPALGQNARFNRGRTSIFRPQHSREWTSNRFYFERHRDYAAARTQCAVRRRFSPRLGWRLDYVNTNRRCFAKPFRQAYTGTPIFKGER